MKGFLLLDWEGLVERVEKLADMIKDSGEKFDGIVTVACGGLTIATLLHDFTGLPIATYTANSYTDIGVVGEYRMKFQVGGQLNGSRILFIDDVSEHGNTFIRGLEHLAEWGAEAPKTAALFLKPHSKFVPDYVVETVDAWVIFPFEYYETVKGLHAKWSSEGMGNTVIMRKLKELGISNSYLFRFANEFGLTAPRINQSSL